MTKAVRSHAGRHAESIARAGVSIEGRADYRLNRQRILDAADDVFARQGVQAPLELIMETAGVGRTTFYRHFADREAVLAHLLAFAIDELEAQVIRHEDKADCLLHVFAFMLERLTRRLSLVEYWSAVNMHHPANRRTSERVAAIFQAPIRRAIDAGLCRADLTVEDIALYGRMLGSAMQGCAPEERHGVGTRAAALLFTGFGPAPAKVGPRLSGL